MEYGPPPLFNQGISARARLAFFSLLSILLIVIDARVKVLDTIRGGVETVLYPVERVLLWPRDRIEAVGSYFTTINRLEADNAQLRAQATQEALQLQETARLRAENAQLRAFAGLRESLPVPTRLVTVLYSLRDPFSRKVIIDAGVRDGIHTGDPVLDDTGVVGQVTRAYPMASEVTLATDKNQATPVRVARNGLPAVAFGSAEPARLELRFLPANADVRTGDEIVTSGLGGLYPSGLPVGTVIRVEHDAKNEFARITMTPAAGKTLGRLLLVLTVPPPPPLPSGLDLPDSEAKAAKAAATRRHHPGHNHGHHPVHRQATRHETR